MLSLCNSEQNLSDPVKRANLDERLRDQAAASSSSASGKHSSKPNKRTKHDEGLRGQANASLKAQGHASGPDEPNSRKVPPTKETLPCSLEMLYSGGTMKVNFIRKITDENGKETRKEEKLNVDIKPGCKKGFKIPFKGKGHERQGVKPSDLIFVVAEKPHGSFTRDGNDLVVTKKIPLGKVLIGDYRAHVTTLDGRELAFLINNGGLIHPNYEEIVPREGMPMEADLSRKGNLRVKFDIQFPKILTPVQKAEVQVHFPE